MRYRMLRVLFIITSIGLTVIGCRSVSKDPTKPGYYSTYKVTLLEKEGNYSPASLSVKVIDAISLEPVTNAMFLLNGAQMDIENPGGVFKTVFLGEKNYKAQVTISAGVYYIAKIPPIKVNKSDSVLLEVYVKSLDVSLHDSDVKWNGKSYRIKD